MLDYKNVEFENFAHFTQANEITNSSDNVASSKILVNKFSEKHIQNLIKMKETFILLDKIHDDLILRKFPIEKHRLAHKTYKHDLFQFKHEFAKLKRRLKFLKAFEFEICPFSKYPIEIELNQLILNQNYTEFSENCRSLLINWFSSEHGLIINDRLNAFCDNVINMMEAQHFHILDKIGKPVIHYSLTIGQLRWLAGSDIKCPLKPRKCYIILWQVINKINGRSQMFPNIVECMLKVNNAGLQIYFPTVNNDPYKKNNSEQIIMIPSSEIMYNKVEKEVNQINFGIDMTETYNLLFYTHLQRNKSIPIDSDNLNRYSLNDSNLVQNSNCNDLNFVYGVSANFFMYFNFDTQQTNSENKQNVPIFFLIDYKYAETIKKYYSFIVPNLKSKFKQKSSQDKRSSISESKSNSDKSNNSDSLINSKLSFIDYKSNNESNCVEMISSNQYNKLEAKRNSLMKSFEDVTEMENSESNKSNQADFMLKSSEKNVFTSDDEYNFSNLVCVYAGNSIFDGEATFYNVHGNVTYQGNIKNMSYAGYGTINIYSNDCLEWVIDGTFEQYDSNVNIERHFVESIQGSTLIPIQYVGFLDELKLNEIDETQMNELLAGTIVEYHEKLYEPMENESFLAEMLLTFFKNLCIKKKNLDQIEIYVDSSDLIQLTAIISNFTSAENFNLSNRLIDIFLLLCPWVIDKSILNRCRRGMWLFVSIEQAKNYNINFRSTFSTREDFNELERTQEQFSKFDQIYNHDAPLMNMKSSIYYCKIEKWNSNKFNLRCNHNHDNDDNETLEASIRDQNFQFALLNDISTKIDIEYELEKERWRYVGGFSRLAWSGFGQLIEVESKKLVYDGLWLTGLPHGNCNLCSYSNGTVYKGMYRNGMRSGNGILLKNNMNTKIYEGQWENDLPHGYGTAYYDTSSYIGDFKNGLRYGKGIYKHNYSNITFDGFWKADLPHEKGIFTDSKGNSSLFDTLNIQSIDKNVKFSKFSDNKFKFYWETFETDIFEEIKWKRNKEILSELNTALRQFFRD